MMKRSSWLLKYSTNWGDNDGMGRAKIIQVWLKVNFTKNFFCSNHFFECFFCCALPLHIVTVTENWRNLDDFFGVASLILKYSIEPEKSLHHSQTSLASSLHHWVDEIYWYFFSAIKKLYRWILPRENFPPAKTSTLPKL